MPVRQVIYQPDLLQRAARDTELERLNPQVQEIVIKLLKQLMRECLPTIVGEVMSDE
jgi:hypothetical protein